MASINHEYSQTAQDDAAVRTSTPSDSTVAANASLAIQGGLDVEVSASNWFDRNHQLYPGFQEEAASASCRFAVGCECERSQTQSTLGDTIQVDSIKEGSRMTLLTVRAAAERLGVGYSTLKRWIGTGRVRTTRTDGGHHRFAEAEIDRLTARQQPERRARVHASDPDESIVGLSARNRLHGFIEEVRVDGLLAQVRLRVGDQTLTAVITADAVRALKLRRGDDGLAIIKSTEVMIARAGARPAPPTKGRGR